MTLAFPLTIAQFSELLFLEDAVFTLQRSDETTGLGSLDPMLAQLATPLWRADCSTGPIENDDAESLAALIEVLMHPGRDFYICNPRKTGPRMDPDGAILDGDPVTFSALNVNNHQVTLAGLPADYVISRGDMFAFDYGPVGQKRRALHRVAETMSATIGGLISNIEVFPHIRTGALVGDVVTLINPAMRAKIIPGSYRPMSHGGSHQRFSFSVIQKLI